MSEGVEVVVVAEVVGDRVAVHPLVSRPPPRRMARPQMEATSRSRWFLGRPSSALDMVSPCWPAPGCAGPGSKVAALGAAGHRPRGSDPVVPSAGCRIELSAGPLAVRRPYAEAVSYPLRAVLGEPPPAGPPALGGGGWALVAVVTLSAVLEGFLRRGLLHGQVTGWVR